MPRTTSFTRSHDLQGIELNVPADRTYRFVADPTQLPRWAEAFASVGEGRAVLRTPRGEVEIALRVTASAETGTVDWSMTFPDGTVGNAYSRVVPLGADRSVYTFVLTPPPVPLERLEGALAEQARTLAAELRRLKHILEDGA